LPTPPGNISVVSAGAFTSNDEAVMVKSLLNVISPAGNV